MRRGGWWIAIIVAALAAGAGSASTLVAAGERVTVARSPLSVRPGGEWNRLDVSRSRSAETWTLDGEALNDVTFYGGIAAGKTLFAEANKRNRPLPHVSSTMLLTDIPALVESSYRIALGTSLMTIDSVEPLPFAGTKGVRFTYSFIRQNEELRRSGEGRAAMVNGRLYMMTFEAPTLHYFGRGLPEFRALADSAAF